MTEGVAGPPRRQVPRTVLAVLLGLFAILTLLDRFVLVELLVRRIGVPLLFACAQALAFVAMGALARRSKTSEPAIDFLLGFPLFGALCFVAGLIRVSAWTLAPLVGIGALAGFLLVWKRVAAGSPDRGPEDSGPAERIGAACVVAVLLCGFVAAQAPPSSLDELAYHLAVPHVWALEGRAVELPLLSHSYFPLGVESASLPALTLLGATSGGIASHFLHLMAAVATAMLLVRQTKSWLVTAAIVSTPALAATAGWSLVDWPLLGLFAVLYMALQSEDRNTASAATAAGMLTKYTFLPFALVAWAMKRKLPGWLVLAGLVFFIRNALLTGSPFAPFLLADAPHLSGYRAVELAGFVFDGDFLDEALGASLLMLPVFATGGIALAVLALGLVLFFLGPSARILVPFLAVPAMSAAESFRRGGLRVLIAIAVVLQMFLVVFLTARTSAFSMLSATMSDEEYLRKARTSHASVEWLNSTLPAGSRTLVVGLGETYWFRQPVRGGGNFDGPRISRYLDVPAPEALRERLRADGITHVAIVTVPLPTDVPRKVEERQTALTQPAQRMLARTLDRYATSVSSRGEVTVFTLR